MNDELYKCLNQQIKWLSIIYIIFNVVDWTIILVGDNLEFTHFYCYSTFYLTPADTKGAWFLTIQTLYFFLFSLILWYIFFRIPANNGLVSGLLVKSMNMTTGMRTPG